MVSIAARVKSLSNRELVEEMLLGPEAFQPGVFDLYVSEAKLRKLDRSTYVPEARSRVDFLASAEVISNVPLSSEKQYSNQAVFPGTVNFGKRSSGVLLIFLGCLFIVLFFLYFSTPSWYVFLLGIVGVLIGAVRFHAGRPIGYLLDSDGLYELTQSATKGTLVLQWSELATIELAEVPRRRSLFSLFANSFFRSMVDLALGPTEHRLMFQFDDGRELYIWEKSVSDFDQLVLSVRRFRNLTTSSSG